MLHLIQFLEGFFRILYTSTRKYFVFSVVTLRYWVRIP